jgi:nicotinamidase/pyrazinamidase
MTKDVLFWDVDTQYDFMRPEGRLYVSGAEAILDNISRVRHFALDNGSSIIASADWHIEGNKEITGKPDFKTIFPPHCVAGKPGSERVGFLGKLQIDSVPNRKMEKGELLKIFDKNQFHVEIQKEELDVFTNPNTREIMQILKPASAVVFGVALDLCVRQAVEGLLGMGVKVYLLRDAVKGLGVKGDDEVIVELSKKGVEIITLSDLEKKF